MLWQSIARPLLFNLPAERAHYLSMGAFKGLLAPPFVGSIFRSRYEVKDPTLHSRVFGLEFQNPVDLLLVLTKTPAGFRNLPA